MGSSIYADTAPATKPEFEYVVDYKVNMVTPPKQKKLKFGGKVRIVEDYREGAEPSAVGAEATFMGHCWCHNGKRYLGSHDHFLQVMPKFQLANGSIIWGVECCWLPLAEAKAAEAQVHGTV